jgi:hypothetical protein
MHLEGKHLFHTEDISWLFHQAEQKNGAWSLDSCYKLSDRGPNRATEGELRLLVSCCTRRQLRLRYMCIGHSYIQEIKACWVFYNSDQTAVRSEQYIPRSQA